MHPPGLEPGTKRLRVFCSTIELGMRILQLARGKYISPQVRLASASKKKILRGVFVDDPFQVFDPNRLAEKSIHAGLQTLLPIAGRGVCGER